MSKRAIDYNRKCNGAALCNSRELIPPIVVAPVAVEKYEYSIALNLNRRAAADAGPVPISNTP